MQFIVNIFIETQFMWPLSESFSWSRSYIVTGKTPWYNGKINIKGVYIHEK